MNRSMFHRNFKNITVIATTLRALRHRNYRLFFAGQGISLIGTWMQTVATGWLVYRLSHSEFMLGVVAFAGQIPAFLLSPFAGVLGDRLNRHRMLLSTQVLAMAQAFALAAFTISGVIQVWLVALLSLFLGLLNAFEMPTRQAFVIEMVGDKADLGNAIALNSGLFNGSRLIGPALAGIIVAAAGEGACFMINAASYTASIAALLLMRIPPRELNRQANSLLRDLKDGLAYSFRFTPIRDLLAAVSLLSMVAMTFPVLMPVFATRILHGDSHTYGFLIASSGMGALAGTVFLAMRKSVLGLGRVISASLLVFGVSIIAFSFSRSFPLSMIILAIVGFGMITTIASCNTVLQTIVDEDKRGRVMSLYVMVFMGSAPLGSMLAGSASTVIGAPLTVCIGGMLSIAGGIVFSLRLPILRKNIRPIYQEMGIIPEVAAGIQTADELRKPPEYSGN